MNDRVIFGFGFAFVRKQLEPEYPRAVMALSRAHSMLWRGIRPQRGATFRKALQTGQEGATERELRPHPHNPPRSPPGS